MIILMTDSYGNPPEVFTNCQTETVIHIGFEDREVLVKSSQGLSHGLLSGVIDRMCNKLRRKETEHGEETEDQPG